MQESHRPLKKIAEGNEIGIETDNQLAFAQGQGMVQISGLGVSILGAVQVAAAEFLCELLHPGASTIGRQLGFWFCNHRGHDHWSWGAGRGVDTRVMRLMGRARD